MKILGLIIRPVAVIAIVTMCAGMALADAQPGTIPFANGQGTMTGYFMTDANATTITDFNFSVTAGGGFHAYTYTPSNSVGVFSSFFGTEVATFTANSNPMGLTQTTKIIITFNCGGPTNCFPLAANGAGTTFELDTLSGELGAPDFSPYRQVSSGLYLNLTDPAGQISFNVGPDVIAGNTLYGGTSTTVPEPSSLLMLGSGLLGTFEALRRRYRK